MMCASALHLGCLYTNVFSKTKDHADPEKENYHVCMGDSFIGNIKRKVKQHLDLDHHHPSCGFTLVSPLSTSRSCSFQCTSVCNITTLYMSIKICNITTLYMSVQVCNIDKLYMSMQNHKPLRIRRCACVDP